MAGGGRPEKLASVRLRRVLLPSERDLQRLPPRIARKSWSCELQSDQMRLPFRKVTGKRWRLVWKVCYSPLNENN